MIVSRLTIIFVLVVIFVVPLTCFPQAERTGTVRGVVATYFGIPLEGSLITFYLLEKRNGIYLPTGGAPIRSVSSNAEGRYEVTDLPPGNYKVTASLRGFPISTINNFVVCPESESDLVFGLKIGITHGLETIRVYGQISDEKGNPFNGASVILQNDFDRTQQIETATDISGRYSYEFIQPGRYIVFTSFLSNHLFSDPFVVDNRNGQKVKVEINLRLKSNID
jgi:hypothetical protein